MKRLLELFCGTKSMGREAEALGWEVVSVDIRADFEPTILCDLLEYDYKAAWKPGEFLMIHASPPCTLYSIAQKNRDPETGNLLTQRTKDIIDYIQPKYVCVENPAASLMWHQGIFPWPKKLASYCKYTDPDDASWGYRKNTFFSSNIPNLKLQICNKDCANMVTFEGRKLHREIAQIGYSSSLPKDSGVQRRTHKQIELYRIPGALCKEILAAVEVAETSSA
jgi:hypothetical protein